MWAFSMCKKVSFLFFIIVLIIIKKYIWNCKIKIGLHATALNFFIIACPLFSTILIMKRFTSWYFDTAAIIKESVIKLIDSLMNGSIHNTLNNLLEYCFIIVWINTYCLWVMYTIKFCETSEEVFLKISSQ